MLTHTANTHTVREYYRTFLSEPIPTVRGMWLFVILLEKTASPFPLLAAFYTSWACRYTLCVSVLRGEGAGAASAEPEQI